MKWIIIGVAAVVLLGGGVVGTLFALGMLGSEPAEAAAERPGVGRRGEKRGGIRIYPTAVHRQLLRQ